MLLTKNNLHNYQEHAIKHGIDNPHAGLLLGMGLGKTISALTIIDYLIYTLDITKTLVVATKRIVNSVWAEQAIEWEHTQHLRFSKIVGTPKQRLAALEEDADIYLVSRDNIAWLASVYGGKKLPFDMLIVDESSSFKNHKSMRFKALKLTLDSFARRIILTGTPVPNGLIDLWSQIFILDQGERLGEKIGEYKAKYFKPDKYIAGAVRTYKLGSKKYEAEIYDRIKDICISMSAADYLDLPPVTYIDVRIDLSPGLMEKYENFVAEKVLELFIDPVTGEQKEITALNAAALYAKLLQFTNGAVYDEFRNVIEVHQEKLDCLEELIEEANGTPVLIATAFQHDAARILDRFKKYKPKVLKTTQDENDWNNDKIDVALLHPASGGHGLNLQKGSGCIIIWFGLTINLEFWDQLNARLARQGQKNPVRIFKLACKNTLDVSILQGLTSKDKLQSSLLTAVKATVKKVLTK